MVEKFVDIRPERVQLAGSAGKPIFAEVTLYPRQEYPFTIRQLGAKNGRYIKYELVQRCTDKDNRCVIRIENTRKKKGRYLDALYVHTNSQMRPVIPIYIMGLIR